MENAKKAIETPATINSPQQLTLDDPLPITCPTQVRVIIMIPDDTDIDEKEWLRAASSNPAFDFLKDAREDIYTLSDGKPFHDQG